MNRMVCISPSLPSFSDRKHFVPNGCSNWMFNCCLSSQITVMQRWLWSSFLSVLAFQRDKQKERVCSWSKRKPAVVHSQQGGGGLPPSLPLAGFYLFNSLTECMAQLCHWKSGSLRTRKGCRWGYQSLRVFFNLELLLLLCLFRQLGTCRGTNDLPEVTREPSWRLGTRVAERRLDRKRHHVCRYGKYCGGKI